MRLLVVMLVVMATLGGCSRAPEGSSRKTLRITGTVVEQVDAAPYSYLRIKTEAGEVWTMVPTANVARNQPVSVVGGYR